MLHKVEYIDLFHNGRAAGRILISFQLQNMNGYWGGQTNFNQQPINNAWNQPQVYPQVNNGGWGQQPPMNNGWGQQPPMNNGGWGQQPPMNNGGWGQQPPMNNGWNNNMPPPNNGWGY